MDQRVVMIQLIPEAALNQRIALLGQAAKRLTPPKESLSGGL
jgi:hypothetical protein